MTRRQAGILMLLSRGPSSNLSLALALDARVPDIANDLLKLSALGVVERTDDGWQLTKKVAA